VELKCLCGENQTKDKRKLEEMSLLPSFRTVSYPDQRHAEILCFAILITCQNSSIVVSYRCKVTT
jgi:hypothetical protein